MGMHIKVLKQGSQWIGGGEREGRAVAIGGKRGRREPCEGSGETEGRENRTEA